MPEKKPEPFIVWAVSIRSRQLSREMRHLTPRKIGGVYEEKQKELQRWIDAGKPQASASDYPWAAVDNEIAAGDAPAPVKVDHILSTWQQKIDQVQKIGLKIEGYEQSAKVEIDAKTNEDEIEPELNFWIGMLDEL